MSLEIDRFDNEWFRRVGVVDIVLRVDVDLVEGLALSSLSFEELSL